MPQLKQLFRNLETLRNELANAIDTVHKENIEKAIKEIEIKIKEIKYKRGL